MNPRIPVVLFAYARPEHLRRTLAGLKTNRIPLLWVFSDGPKDAGDAAAVVAVRKTIQSIDWCETHVVERVANLGLGRSVLSGVSEVFRLFEMLVVVEDDIVLIDGAYDYVCAALNHYQSDARVMSVAGWTHASVRPNIAEDSSYFDGRFSCWGWGSWRRAWCGMGMSARTLAFLCRMLFRNVGRYGWDIPGYARRESELNIWAVRFVLLHMLRRGLCFHSPYSLVDNIGFDASATHTTEAAGLAQAMRERAPSIPTVWPEALEHPDCARLWRDAYPRLQPRWRMVASNIVRQLKRARKRKGDSDS